MATRPLSIEDLYRFAIPGDPNLSPDGARIAYTLSTQDADEDRTVTSIWEVRSAGGAPRRLTNGPADSAPRWAPDGSALAFLREGQLFLMRVDGGGEPAALTAAEMCPADAGPAVWSPDGARIAFTAATAKPDDTAPRVTDTLDWKADGAGWVGGLRTHLFVLEVETGELRQITSGDFSVSFPAWSPDGRRIAFSRPVGADPDLTFASGAFVVDVDAPDPEPVCITPVAGFVGPLTWFPDGEAVLFVGSVRLENGHNRLVRQPVDGSPATELGAALDRNVMTGGTAYPGARPSFVGDDLVFCARDRGTTRLYRWTTGDQVAEIPLPPRTAVQGCTISPKAGAAALALADGGSFGEIAILELATGDLRVLTRHMAEALPDVALFPVVEREFTVSDGIVVHGMITRDPATPPGGPLLLGIHGGPHNAWAPFGDQVFLYHQELAARGWTILTLNVRASDGYGEDFYTAAVGNWGLADEPDFLEPVAELVAEGLVDGDRIAVTGGSYGGYMTCWLTARSDIFKAAVTVAPIVDLTSMAGTSDAGHYFEVFDLAGAKERFEEMSPLTHVGAVRVPTLILHGDADERCPVGQAEQWFSALRVAGVPARLVLYPGASHFFIFAGRPSHRADFNRRVVDWVTEHVG